MSNFAILINPFSGMFSDEKIRDRVTEMLTTEGHTYRVFETDAQDGANKAAHQALKMNPNGIIVCGGDGTMFEVINSVQGCSFPILIVPCGTGNDFFKMLNLPKDPIEALRIQLHCNPCSVDIGRMNEYYFMNVAGTGFDVDVLRAADKYKQKYKGIRPYFYGLVEAIKHYKPVQCRLKIDDSEAFSTSNAIISIGNGSYIGGGMKAVPDARIDDGLFNIVMVKPVHKVLILPLVLFFILGLHIRIGLAEVHSCKKAIIECPGMVVNLDGELKKTDCAEFELISGGIVMQLPE